MDKNQLIKFCNDGYSTYKIASVYDVSQNTVRYWLKKYGLSTKGWFTYDEIELKKITLESFSYNEILRKLGKSSSASSYRSLHKAIKRFNVDTSHLLNKSEIMKLKRIENHLNNDELFVENSTSSRSTIKKRIIQEHLIEYRCSLCTQDNIWQGQNLVLILDHINGKNNDNRLENLRFVCPNCNSQLITHCRNKKNGEIMIKKPKVKTKRRYIPNYNIRKVVRPDISILKEQVNNIGYTKTGRLYGVSPTSIRKWIKWASNQS